MPHSLDGKACWNIATRPGVRHYAGMTGVIVGLDWSVLLALAAADGVQPAVASYLFSIIELAMLIALQESADG